MFSFKNLYSENYSDYEKHREKIKVFVELAREKIRGSTIYGKPVNLNNPEDIIACLYLMNKEMGLYHEPL